MGYTVVHKRKYVGRTPAPDIVAPPNIGETLLSNFQLGNYAAGTSPGYAKFGMWFPQGDVPAGNIVVVRDNGANLIAFQLDQRTTWPDGSLRGGIAKIRDTVYLALQLRSYNMYRKVGSWDNATTVTLSSLLSLVDPQLRFTSLTDTQDMASGNADSGTTTTMIDAARIGAGVNFFVGDELWFLNGPNSGLSRTITSYNTATGAFGFAAFPSAVAASHAYVILRTLIRASGTALSALATHAAITTRVTRIAGGPVYDEFQVWGMVKDGPTGAGAEDAHLKVNWYLQAYKQAGGAVDTVLCVAVPSQDWWSVAGKRRLNYNAELLNGASSVQIYSSATMPAYTTFGWSTIQHRYHAQWATVRLQDDDGHGRPQCIMGTLPTLYSKPNRQYWIDSKNIPPFNLAVAFPNPITDISYFGGDQLPKDYTAFSSQGSRGDPDSTGGYMDRGLWPSVAACAFMRQNSIDYRYARVCAHAGLHYPMGTRSSRNRTRPSEIADVANTPIALKMDTKAPAVYDFTADGMPIAVHAYVQASAAFNDGWVNPGGNAGARCNPSPSWNASHANNHCEFIYLLEGERYMLERHIDLTIAAIVGNFGNSIGSRPALIDYEDTTFRAAFSIPATQWSGCLTRWASNARAIGWHQAMLAAMAAFIPDNDVYTGYLRLLSQHAADHMRASIDFPAMPQSYKDAGLWAYSTRPSAFMHNVIAMGVARSAMVSGNSDRLYVANMIANHAIGPFRVGRPYLTQFYQDVYLPSQHTTYAWISGTNEFFPLGQRRPHQDATINGATGVLTFSWAEGFTIHNGDTFYVPGMTEGGSFQAIPPELNLRQLYYAVQASGKTCKLSATPGGAPITYAASGTFGFSMDLSDFTITPMNSSIYLPPSADNYCAIAYAALIVCFRAGCSSVLQSDVDAAKAFIAPTIWDDIGCSWAMA